MAFSFPLAERELNRSGKRVRTYVLRAVIAGALFLVLSFQGGATNAETIGRTLVSLTAFFQAGVALLLAPAMAAGLVAREKQDRTLGLLLMADLRGWDIFTAKWLAVVMEVVLLILTPLPVLAFAAFFGGVSVSAMAYMVVLFIATGVTLCTLGLYASTVATRPSEALAVCAVIELVWIGVTWAVDSNVTTKLGPLNPVYGAMLAADDAAPTMTGALLICLALSALFAIRAVWVLPSQAYEKPRVVRRSRRRANRWKVLRLPAEAHLFAASAAGVGGSARTGLGRLFVMIVLAAVAAVPCAGDMLFILIFFYSVIAMVQDITDTGALENMLTTPCDRRKLGGALILGCGTRGLIFLPGTIVFGATKFAFYFTFDQATFALLLDSYSLAALVIIGYAIMFAAQYMALTAFAAAVGIQPGRSAIKTVFAVSIFGFLYVVTTLVFIMAMGVLSTAGQFSFYQLHAAIIIMVVALSVFVYFVSRAIVIDWMEQAAFFTRAQGYAG